RLGRVRRRQGRAPPFRALSAARAARGAGAGGGGLAARAAARPAAVVVGAGRGPSRSSPAASPGARRSRSMIPESVFEQSIRSLFAPVAVFLDDPSVSEILINGPSEIYVERRGRLERTAAAFSSPRALTAAL